jgi:hypothetical protein
VPTRQSATTLTGSRSSSTASVDEGNDHDQSPRSTFASPLWVAVLLLNIIFSLITVGLMLAVPVVGPIAFVAFFASPSHGIPGTLLSVALVAYAIIFFLSFLKCQRARANRNVSAPTLVWALAPALAIILVWHAPGWGSQICGRGLTQCITGRSDDGAASNLSALAYQRGRESPPTEASPPVPSAAPVNSIPLPGAARPMERDPPSSVGVEPVTPSITAPASADIALSVAPTSATTAADASADKLNRNALALQCEREESQELAWFWRQRPDEATRAAKVRELMHNCLVAQGLPD